MHSKNFRISVIAVLHVHVYAHRVFTMWWLERAGTWCYVDTVVHVTCMFDVVCRKHQTQNKCVTIVD